MSDRAKLAFIIVVVVGLMTAAFLGALDDRRRTVARCATLLRVTARTSSDTVALLRVYPHCSSAILGEP